MTPPAGPGLRFALGPRVRRTRAESVVPMINIVFLLLVFFLLSATIVPPEPLEISPPAGEGSAEEDAGEAVLHLGRDGSLAFGDLRGEAALAAATDAAQLVLRADAEVEGAAFAALLARLAAAGVETAALVVVPP